MHSPNRACPNVTGRLELRWTWLRVTAVSASDRTRRTVLSAVEELLPAPRAAFSCRNAGDTWQRCCWATKGRAMHEPASMWSMSFSGRSPPQQQPAHAYSAGRTCISRLFRTGTAAIFNVYKRNDHAVVGAHQGLQSHHAHSCSSPTTQPDPLFEPTSNRHFTLAHNN